MLTRSRSRSALEYLPGRPDLDSQGFTDQEADGEGQGGHTQTQPGQRDQAGVLQDEGETSQRSGQLDQGIFEPQHDRADLAEALLLYHVDELLLMIVLVINDPCGTR